MRFVLSGLCVSNHPPDVWFGPHFCPNSAAVSLLIVWHPVCSAWGIFAFSLWPWLRKSSIAAALSPRKEKRTTLQEFNLVRSVVFLSSVLQCWRQRLRPISLLWWRRVLLWLFIARKARWVIWDKLQMTNNGLNRNELYMFRFLFSSLYLHSHINFATHSQICTTEDISTGLLLRPRDTTSAWQKVIWDLFVSPCIPSEQLLNAESHGQHFLCTSRWMMNARVHKAFISRSRFLSSALFCSNHAKLQSHFQHRKV